MVKVKNTVIIVREYPISFTQNEVLLWGNMFGKARMARGIIFHWVHSNVFWDFSLAQGIWVFKVIVFLGIARIARIAWKGMKRHDIFWHNYDNEKIAEMLIDSNYRKCNPNSMKMKLMWVHLLFMSLPKHHSKIEKLRLREKL